MIKFIVSFGKKGKEKESLSFPFVSNKTQIIEKKQIKKEKPNEKNKNIDNKKQVENNQNINNNSINEILPNEAVKKEYTPGIIGLTNIGATCYMNATLQCFSNIKRFKENLLRICQNSNKNQNQKKLSFALAEVFKNLWVDIKDKEYAPNNFKVIIGEMNKLFKGVAANDPKDLVLYLLETIHNELNMAPKKKIDTNYGLNNQNFNEVLKEFIDNFTNENSSIICEEFYGCTNSMTMCCFCQATIHNIQALNILFFPLEEVRKFSGSYNNQVTIENCFLYYQKQEVYPSFYCNNCRQLYTAYNISKLIYTPPTLIINLNRGRGIEFKVGINFEEYLDLKNYIYAQDSPSFYELVGVISHLGTNDMGGHFIAFCKNSNNYQWYKFNDGIVTVSSFNEIKEIGMPYVLFYSYMIN